MTTHQSPTEVETGARLAALAARVSVIPSLRCATTPRGHALRVFRPGEAEDDFGPSALIICKARQDDGGKLWFFDQEDEPLAEAHDITGASVRLLRKLRS